MSADRLAAYRRSGQPAATRPDSGASPKPEYRAFSAVSSLPKPVRLELRSKGGFAIARAYSAITEIAYYWNSYDRFYLLFPGKQATVEGSNLKPVIEGLIAGTCEWIAELRDDEAAPPGAPVIRQIILVSAEAPKSTAAKKES